MIQTTIRMIFEAGKKDEAIAALLATVGQIRAEEGCLRSAVRSDAEDAQVVVYEELWRGKEAWAHHQRSEGYHKVLAVLGMASVPPDIQSATITASSGLELIKKARLQDKE